MIKTPSLIKKITLLSLGLLLSHLALAAEEPLVYKTYTQQALDKAYDQSKWADHDFKNTISGYATDSAIARESYKPVTVAYGSGPRSTLDIFSLPGAKALPVMVFIHGGAWKSLSKDDASAPAPTFIREGVIYIALDFPNIPEATLPQMVQHCREAMAWIYKNIANYGGDPEKINVSGHSSGGHLAATLLTTDWQSYQMPKDLIKSGLLISGIYDLKPAMLSSRGAYLKLNAQEVHDYSPIDKLANLRAPVTIVFGEKESPEFKRQAEAFVAALEQRNAKPQLIRVANRDHFKVLNELNDPSSAIALAAIKQIQSSPR